MDSLWEDFKYNLAKSTRLNQIILINVSIFIILLLARIILNIADGGNQAAFAQLTDWLSLHSDMTFLLKHPWILVSHMFTHIGIWHLIWNMLSLYWFGNIVGDLLGDKYIWRIYLFSGLFGAFIILLFSWIFQFPASHIVAYGASAAVMGFVVAAAVIAPDYLFHLMIIGEVRLKYVALVILLIDLAGIAEQSNTGGHLGHLGGAIGGAVFIWLLRSGIEWPEYQSRKEKPEPKIIPISESINKRSKVTADSGKASSSSISKQEEIDRILDKISAKGMNSLTKEEKELLDSTSNNS